MPNSPVVVLLVVQFAGSMAVASSVQFQSTVTSVFDQPLALGSGVRVGLATGPVESVL